MAEDKQEEEFTAEGEFLGYISLDLLASSKSGTLLVRRDQGDVAVL